MGKQHTHSARKRRALVRAGLGFGGMLCLAGAVYAGQQSSGGVPLASLSKEQAPFDAAELPEGSQQIAVLRTLDKITGRISELNVAVGGIERFGTLNIKVEYCRTRPPIETPESFAFVEIDDMGVSGGQSERVFEGWMLASSPALNPLEHAVYDVWVIQCKTSAGDAENGNF